jgi:hypothetical protein
MAEVRVGLGALFFAPNRRFMMAAAWVCVLGRVEGVRPGSMWVVFEMDALGLFVYGGCW